MRKITTPEQHHPTPPPAASAAEHLRNPTLAQALFAIWSGDPAVVIDSPPGAGKTHLITHLAHQLHTRAGMTVAIAAQTRAQATDVANRTSAIGTPTVLLTGRNTGRPRDLHADVTTTHPYALRTGAGVIAATTARWLWTPTTRVPHFDVLLIDEAYQLTFSGLESLGALADQFVLVGDPGQIAPVVTGNSRRWATDPTGPHQPAPHALLAAHGDDIARLRLPHTWRFGPDTTALLTPLYPTLPFTSARPPRHLTIDGHHLPEYRALPHTITGGTADPHAIHAATHTLRTLLTHATLTTPTTTAPLTPNDLALITPHVEQAALAAAHLADLPGVFVGTINQAQGLQREAVVALHPLLGHEADEQFALDLGRLCVALSRHRSHLTVVTDAATPDRLAGARSDRPGQAALAVQAEVLESLSASEHD